MTYVGLTKGDLLKQWEDVPDDAPLYVPIYAGCFGLAKVESTWYCKNDDDAEHTQIPLGFCLIDIDFEGAQEPDLQASDGFGPDGEEDE